MPEPQELPSSVRKWQLGDTGGWSVSVVFPTGQLRSAIIWRPRREPIRVRAPVRLSGTLLSKMGSRNASLGLRCMPTLRDIVYENVREGELYEKLDRNRVRCFACGHCCPIPEGQPGVCKVRYNRGGPIRSLGLRRCSAVRPYRKEAVLPRISRRIGVQLRNAGL